MSLEKIKQFYKLISVSFFIQLTYIGSAMAYEEPDYRLIKSTDVYEIRYYEDRLAIQTLQSSGNDRAFGRLFEYISGSNQSSSKISMTTPVIEVDEGNGSLMHFFLPKNYTKQSAPAPQAKNVKLVIVKGGYYAVIRYSGRSTNQNHQRYSTVLQEALNRDGVTFRNRPIKAIYNGPFTPAFLRRNEAMFLIDWD